MTTEEKLLRVLAARTWRRARGPDFRGQFVTGSWWGRKCRLTAGGALYYCPGFFSLQRDVPLTDRQEAVNLHRLIKMRIGFTERRAALLGLRRRTNA